MKVLSRLYGCLLAVVVLSATVPAQAQPTEGSNEVSGGVSFFRPHGTGAGTLNLDLAYGYYLDPTWEVGIRQGYTGNFDDDRRDIWNAVTSPYINYNFTGTKLFGLDYSNSIVPFVGGFVGAVWNDEDFTGTVGPQAGLKAYFTRSAFMRVQYRYEWFFDELESANDFQDSNHVVTLGFGYAWGGNT